MDKRHHRGWLALPALLAPLLLAGCTGAARRGEKGEKAASRGWGGVAAPAAPAFGGGGRGGPPPPPARGARGGRPAAALAVQVLLPRLAVPLRLRLRDQQGPAAV